MYICYYQCFFLRSAAAHFNIDINNDSSNTLKTVARTKLSGEVLRTQSGMG